MPTVQCARAIDAPRAPLFALAQDYALRLDWDPFLREMRFLDGASEAGVGVRVWVRAKNGLTMTVRYLTVNAPSQVAMTMTEGPWMFRKFSGSWGFKEITPTRTLVTFRYHFELRSALVPFVGDPIVSRVLSRDMAARLEGLDRGARTGLLERLPK